VSNNNKRGALIIHAIRVPGYRYPRWWSLHVVSSRRLALDSDATPSRPTALRCGGAKKQDFNPRALS
jgi:hypothetical protein